jgi:poly-gamma-glutamate synthesis protein (capsule biosynthesis protein)
MSVSNIYIYFLGDIMLGERFEKLNRGVISKIDDGIDPFQFCKDDLSNSDLNVANLECVVSSSSDKSLPFSKFMKIDSHILDYLVNNNIGIVNIANNHIMDHGEKAFFETRENLDLKGIKYFGFDDGTGIQIDPLIVESKGNKIAFLGYDLSNLNNNEFENKVGEISEILESTVRNFDYLILSLHWGYEYSNSPTSYMIKAAEKFFERGVDILYGHHPHILQGITKVDDKIFAPSLGNFIFDDERIPNRTTGILSVEFSKENIDYKFLSYFSNEEFQPINNQHLMENFDYLVNLLDKNIESFHKADLSFDQIILNESKMGHLNNMKRVRKEIIRNYSNYLIYLPQIVKTKLIDKRLKKIFNN